MQAAPVSLACKEKCTLRTQATTGQPKQPAFPAQWFTAYTRSPRCTGLFSHRRLAHHQERNLTPASGRQDHATSPSASATFVRRAIRVHRIPAPRFVTIGRNVPLHRGGMRETIVVICPTAQAKRCATDWHDGQIADVASNVLPPRAIRGQDRRCWFQSAPVSYRPR